MKKVGMLWRRQIMLFAVVYLFLVSNYWLGKKKKNRKKLYVLLEIVCFSLVKLYTGGIFHSTMGARNNQTAAAGFSKASNIFKKNFQQSI